MAERLRGLWPLLATLLSAVAIVVVVVLLTDDGERERETAPKTTTVDGPDADTKQDDKLPLPGAAQDLMERAEDAPGQYDLGGDLRGPDKKPAGKLEGPLASQEWPGCRTAFVKSFSARTEAVKGIGLHYTAGGNLTGLADMLGLTAYSNNTANQRSDESQGVDDLRSQQRDGEHRSRRSGWLCHLQTVRA
jgi:hypothetical protein